MTHDGFGFDRTWSRAEFLALAIRNGRRAVGALGDGLLQPGALADYIVIDFDQLALLFARGNASHVAEVVVVGRTIARDGLPTGIDLPALEAEMRAAYRKTLQGQGAFLSAWTPLEGEITRWYADACACGA